METTTNIFDLISKKQSDEKVKEFLETLNLEEQRYEDAVYLQDKKGGVSLCFNPEESTLQYIVLYNSGVDGFSKSAFPLPYSIKFGTVNSLVVSRFGDTPSKGGGTLVPIWISYENLGVKFTFKNAIWEDVTNPISSITLFQPANAFMDEVVLPDDALLSIENLLKYTCSVCVKNHSKTRCKQGCSVVYCSDKCREDFSKIHCNFCKMLY